MCKGIPAETIRQRLASAPPELKIAAQYSWRKLLARPNQLAPGTEHAENPRADWTYWILLAGRGFGKTRAGAEWVCEQARKHPGCHIALVGATVDDVRKTMLSAGLESNGEASGILRVARPDFRPVYEPSKRLVSWPNGSVGTLYTAEEPDRLRGPQHHFAWVDEIAAWAKLRDAWDMLLMGLRLGSKEGIRPQACITTTPRPIPLLRELLADPDAVVSRGTTYENRDNLAPSWFKSILKQYEGTRLGRQELNAELLTDVPGALWSKDRIEDLRVQALPERLLRVVVAIDPAVTSNASSDETGIVVAAIGPCEHCPPDGDGRRPVHGFVLADGSGKFTPSGWARRSIDLFHKHRADKIIGEVNNGGDLIESNLRAMDRAVPYLAVHATRGKQVRAEPVSALYEQGRIHHVGVFPTLEDQMCTWDPTAGGLSPDRMDALVWAFTELMLGEQMAQPLAYRGGERARMASNEARDWSRY